VPVFLGTIDLANIYFVKLGGREQWGKISVYFGIPDKRKAIYMCVANWG
jgi:hypothetical protein